MSERSSGSGLGWTLGLAFTIGTFAVGPIDLPRTVYNTLVGDSSLLKSRLTEYVREGIRREKSALEPSQVEQMLGNELKASLENGSVNPESVAIERLWDSSEDYARSGYERWVWPTLIDGNYPRQPKPEELRGGIR